MKRSSRTPAVSSRFSVVMGGVLLCTAASSMSLPVAAGRVAENRVAERSVSRLHEDLLVVDTHVDIPIDFATATADPSHFTTSQFDLPKARIGGLDAVFLVLYTAQGDDSAAGHAMARTVADARWHAIDRLLEAYPDQAALALCARDVRRTHRTGRMSILIGMENAYPLGRSVDDVPMWRARGVRYVGLTHVGDNQFGTSAEMPDGRPTPADADRGLLPLGGILVRALNDAGILVDVSHASRATMMQAAAISTAPVIASHSGVRAIADSPRNLDDEQLRMLARTGGVIQVFAHPGHLRTEGASRMAAIRTLRVELGLGDPSALAQMSPEQRARYAQAVAGIDQRFGRTSVTDLADHIDHAVAVAGIDHVGIASDFDGGGGIDGWNDASETAAVTAELVRRGYTPVQLGKLWGGNLLRALEQARRRALRPADLCRRDAASGGS